MVDDEDALAHLQMVVVEWNGRGCWGGCDGGGRLVESLQRGGTAVLAT